MDLTSEILPEKIIIYILIHLDIMSKFKVNINGMNRLRNHDFPIAYKRIVFHLGLEETDFAVEDVQQAYEAIVAHDKKLIQIKNGDARHKNSEKIAQLRDARHQYLLSLRGIVVYYRRSPSAEERKAAENLFRWLDKEHKYLRGRTIDGQTQSVYSMEDNLVVQPELSSDLAKLGLTDIQNSIVEITSELDMAVAQRTIDRRVVTKKNRELRREAFVAMEVFVTALEQTIALNKGDKVRYQEFLNGIEDTITRITLRYDSEATRRQNAKIEAEAKAKAAAKAAAEADKNANHENGEQGGADVMPMGGKLVMTAGRSKPFSPKVLDDMDLQQDGDLANVAMRSAAAMSDNANVTSGQKPDGDDEKEVIDPTAGASGMREDVGNEAVNKSPGDDAAISE